MNGNKIQGAISRRSLFRYGAAGGAVALAGRAMASAAAVPDFELDEATIADLQAQVAALIAGNAADITPEQLQAVADGLTAVDTTIKGIAPAPVVEPPVV